MDETDLLVKADDEEVEAYGELLSEGVHQPQQRVRFFHQTFLE